MEVRVAAGHTSFQRWPFSRCQIVRFSSHSASSLSRDGAAISEISSDRGSG